MNNSNFKNINEGIQDLLGDMQTSIPDSIISGSKKKKRSILDEIPDIEQEILSDDIKPIDNGFLTFDKIQQETGIVLPKPIQEEILDNVIKQTSTKNRINEIQKLQKIRAKNKAKLISIEEPIKNQQIIQEVKESLEIIRGEELPDNVDYVTLEEEIDTALNDIPDGSSVEMIDIDIKVSDKKDKSGYFKTKVCLKSDGIPDQINKISSYVKSKTKGLISPRICDFRVIGNTNKTQLRGKSLQLSKNTIVFKPDATKLKVNKGTRFMISVPENYDSTGNLLVYIQESRAKHILELESKDFPSEDVFNEFIGDRIAEYYMVGYSVAVKKLQLHKINNPLMQLIDVIVGTNEYKAKPYIDGEDHLYSIDFISKGTQNQWLLVNVIDSDVQGTYKILAHNTADPTWEYQISKADVTLGQLLKNFYQILDSCYSRDWASELNLDGDDDRFYYLYDKLTHRPLKQALISINDFKKENEEFGIDIKETLSKRDTSKNINQEYNAESIIGKTNNVNYFILTYLAFQVESGDKRSGKQYITSEKYYEKYNVGDKRPYQERGHTALKKQNAERNYHARIYMYQLEYLSNGTKHVYRSESYDDIINTGFLTDTVNFPISKY